jgi:hypothetical protein
MDFVIGHPRSGTQFVAELLNAGRPGVAAHELLATLDARTVALASAFYEGRADAAEVAAVVRAYPPDGPRIDANWKLTWLLEPLLDAHPHARVVHLVRDPRENLRSCLSLDYYGELVRHAAYQTDDMRNHWLANLPRIRVDGFDAASLLEKNCAFYNETHRLALAVGKRSRRLEVRMEDLARGEVGALFDFLEVERPTADALARVCGTRHNAKLDEKQEVASLKRASWPPFSDWSPADRALLVERCGELARRFGYPI